MGGASSLQFDLWVPVGAQPQVSAGISRLDARGSRWLTVIARRATGVPVEQARSELAGFVASLDANYAGYTDSTGTVFLFSESPANRGVAVLRPVLLFLMSVAVIVLLIACANLAGLLWARAAARQREMAIRLSVGAGRLRIVQQLLVEAGLLALAGTAAALVALRWTAGLLQSFAPPSELPIFIDVAVDARVMIFTATLALGTLILFAFIPAWQATYADLSGTLRDAMSSGRGTTRHRLRRGLVGAQMALSTILLVAAGLCLRSLAAAQTMRPGFVADGVVIGWVDLTSANYSAGQGRALCTRILDRLRELPGVEAGSMGRRIPLGFTGISSSYLTPEGYQGPLDEPRLVNVNYVGPDYLRTLEIPLIAGRDLTAADVVGQPLVAIITEATARTYFPDGDPIGRRFTFARPPFGEERWITVVGVARDIKQRT